MPKFFASRTFYECVWVSSLDHKWHSAGFLSLGVLGRVRLLKRLQSLIKLSYGAVVMWGHNIRRWTLTSQGCIMSQHTETNQGIAPLTVALHQPQMWESVKAVQSRPGEVRTPCIFTSFTYSSWTHTPFETQRLPCLTATQPLMGFTGLHCKSSLPELQHTYIHFRQILLSVLHS